MIDINPDSIHQFRYPYKPRRGAPINSKWPPKGLGLKVTFKPPNHSNLKIKVIIHYEIFDDVPIISKYLTVEAKEPLSLGFGPLEILSLNWQWSDQG